MLLSDMKIPFDISSASCNISDNHKEDDDDDDDVRRENVNGTMLCNE
jgi:hypothetical protein